MNYTYMNYIGSQSPFRESLTNDRRHPVENPMRRTPIRARRATPRRTTSRDEHPYPPSLLALPPELRWASVRATIYARCRGRCEVCGESLHGSMEAHHRLKRRYGPDCSCNALALCSRCHHGRVHGDPTPAIAEGWMLSSVRAGVVPGDERVTIHGHPGDVWLTCDGDYRFDLTEPDPAGSVAPEHPSREGAPREGSTP